MRSTMHNKWPDYLMILHVYQQNQKEIDKIDIRMIINKFIPRIYSRKQRFNSLQVLQY